MAKSRIKATIKARAGDLLPCPKNPRTHPDAQRDAVKAQIDRFGWVDSFKVFEVPKSRAKELGVDADAFEFFKEKYGTKPLMLFDAHLRRDIAPDDEVDVAVTDLTVPEALSLIATFDYTTTLAEYDVDIMTELLSGQTGAEDAFADLVESIQFDFGIIEPPAEAVTEEEELPDATKELQAKWQTAFGQVWKITGKSGIEHWIACGDATSSEDVNRLLSYGDTLPSLMVTDPPYGVNYDPSWRREYDPRWKYREGEVENDDQAGWADAYELFPGDVAYVWHAGIHASEVADDIIGCGFAIRSQIIWKKPTFVFGRGAYHWGHEPCWYAVRDGATAQWGGDRTQSTIWEIPNVHKTQGTTDDGVTEHGTQKPIECMARPMRNHECPVIYDPFVGSGTSIVAAEQLKRQAFAMELNPGYVAVVLERMSRLGAKAELTEESTAGTDEG